MDGLYCCIAQVFSLLMQKHPEAQKYRYTTLLYYEDLKAIYGKDLATGNYALGTAGNFETFT